MTKTTLHVDDWIWGTETIIWGFESSHKYTFKVLAPKKGRLGCLSLQYHHEKSESWFQYTGIGWALLIIEDTVCTRLLRPGDIQNIETGTIHRLMGVTDDCRVLEPSTPDKHAADKSVTKDVVRLHCVLGREVSPARDAKEVSLIEKAVLYTEEAIKSIESGSLPVEHNAKLLIGNGSYRIG